MNRLNHSKGWLCIVLLLLVSVAGQAQYLRTSYFMEGSHYRQQLNPALAPGRGYLNLPVIGSLNASVNSSSLGYQDILDIIDNSSDGDYFMSDAFMNRLSDINNLNVSVNTDIISAGWYKGKNFWSFNIGARADIGASIPKAMFQFMQNMNGLDYNDWNILRNLSEGVNQAQTLEINSYAEVGIGFARQINKRLTVGGKVKVLLGVANTKLSINQIDVQSHLTGVDNIDGNNLTPSQIANIQGNASIKVDAELESSSKLLELSQENGSGYIDEIEFGDFGFAGYGGAIDLGASYKLLDRLTLSASILDLGFIKWNKDYTSVARARTNQSYNLQNDGDRYQFVDIVSSGEILNYDMLQMEVENGVEKDRTSHLTSTLVVGAEFDLLKEWLSVGALYTSRFAKPKTLNELTFSANIHPKNYFNVAVSYSVIQAAGQTFGAAVKLGPLFVGTDYMFLGKNTKNVNAYLGFSIPLNKQKKVAM